MVLLNNKGKKMKKVLMSVLAMGTMTIAANAGCVASGCYSVTIDELLVTNTGNIFIATDGIESALNCTSPGNVYMVLDGANAGQKMMYSLLLTSKTTNKPVTIRIEEGTSNCRVSYVK